MATPTLPRGEALDRARAHSPFLREALGIHPRIGALFEADGAGAAIADALTCGAEEVGERLRLQRHGLALAVALGDLAGELTLEEVTAALSDFADRAIDEALAAAMHERVPGAPTTGFTVLAMGKLGSHELNYSSDVDLIFLYDPAILPRRAREEPGQAAVRVGRRAVELLQARTAHGYVARVDMRLRPAPEVTPIALPIDAALSHYEAAALPWERAAFIRARACAGDRELGRRFLSSIGPFIWRRSLDFGVVEEIRGISTRIRDHYSQGQLFGPGFDLKRGRGGIREVEFLVQIEQLIHAGRAPELRVPATLDALAALTDAGKLDGADAAALSAAYRALRTAEHRVQMIDDQQTHLLPADAALDGVARLSGLADGSALLDELRPHVTRVEQLFGALSGEATDERLSGDPMLLTAALGKLGFADASAAAARVAEWRSGRARSLRSPAAREALEAMLVTLLRAIATGPEPMRALNRLSDLIERLSSGVNLYRLVAARPELGRVLALILGHAPALADQLARRPDLLDGLVDDSAFAEPLDAAQVVAALNDAAGASAFDQRLDRVRRWVNERRFALGVQVIARTRDPLRIAEGYAHLAEGAIQVLAAAAEGEFAQRHGRVPGGALAILGLGRLGGSALTHASDLDLVYLFDAPHEARSDGERPLGATEYYNRLASRVSAALSVSTAAGPLYDVDTRLRPQGANGLLAVRLDAFADYQRSEAWTFEHMALTRARAVFGAPELRTRIGNVLAEVLAPRDAAKVAADAAAMRADMRRHKPPAGAWDIKLGPGGLVDLEFAIHVRQLATGCGQVPGLAQALAELEQAGLAPAGMREAHDLLTRLLVVLRLVVPDGGEPPRANHDLVAAACGAPSWSALLAELAEARQEVAAWWSEVGEQR